MAPELRIGSLSEVGEEEVASVTGGFVSFGREPENNIVVDSASVSRRHALISEAGSQWVIRDLESTNGSWLNNVRIIPNIGKLIRDTDLVQLADFQFRVYVSGSSSEEEILRGQAHPSLIIFLGDRFQSEFPLFGDGASFSVGGPEGHIYIDGSMNPETQLDIQLGAEGLVLHVNQNIVPVIVNGMAAVGALALNDRDTIEVGPYLLLVNHPGSVVQRGAAKSRREPPHPASVGAVRTSATHNRDAIRTSKSIRIEDLETGWSSEATRRKGGSGRRFIFKANADDAEPDPMGTVSMASQDFQSKSGFEMNISQRFSALGQIDDDDSSHRFSKVVVVLGAILIAALLGLSAFVLIQFSS